MESKAKLGSLKAVLLLDKEFPAHDENAITLSKVLSGYSEFDGPCPAHSDDVCCILSTSGTTGKPKQAMFTHNNILFSERSYTADLDLTPDDVMWMPSPLNHATGFYHGLISPMLTGSRCVLQLHFKAAEAIELINREHVTWSCGATPFVHDLIAAMEENGTAIPSLRFYLCGGAPCAQHAHRARGRTRLPSVRTLWLNRKLSPTCASRATSVSNGMADSRALPTPASR